MAAANEHTFSIVFDCNGNAVGKFRNEMTVRLVEPELIEWEMASDEHGFHGLRHARRLAERTLVQDA